MIFSFLIDQTLHHTEVCEILELPLEGLTEDHDDKQQIKTFKGKWHIQS